MDWPKLIADLKAARVTMTHIANEAGVKQPTILAIASGDTKNPCWEIGQTIINLHVKHCGQVRRPVVGSDSRNA